MATSGRSPRVWIDVELGATFGSPAASIDIFHEFSSAIGPPTEAWFFRRDRAPLVRGSTTLSSRTNGTAFRKALGLAVSVLCAALLIPWDAAGIDAPSGGNALSVCDPAPLMFTMQEWALARRSGRRA